MSLFKKIATKMTFLVFIAVMATFLITSVSFYIFLDSQTKADLKSKVVLLSESLNYTTSNVEYLSSIFLDNQYRISYIDIEGEVLYDNYKDAESLENHKQRPEIIAAQNNGSGYSKRTSQTAGVDNYYYAMKLNDGTFIRISKSADSVISLIFKFLTPVFISCVICIIITLVIITKLTRAIVKPINEINLDDKNVIIYDELAPLARKIYLQKEEIENQILDIKNRSETINNITKNMKEGIILIDNNGVILSCNEAVNNILSYSYENIEGKNILLINRNMEFINKINKALLGSSEQYLLNSNDKYYNVYINPSYFNGEKNGAIILFLDITNEHLSGVIRAEFSANVSHELKTPLTSIMAISEMIENKMVLPEDISNFASKIKNQSKALLTLIEDIIKLSKLDEGNIGNYEKFDIGMLVNEITYYLKPIAQERNVNISFSNILDDSTIFSSKALIYQLIFNLVDNAVKYNKENGNVNIVLENNFDIYKKIRLIVKDTGIGIEEIYFDRIFERFYRVDKSRFKKVSGTGLGLSIVKHIVKILNGKISIESKLDVGTTIIIEFPPIGK